MTSSVLRQGAIVFVDNVPDEHGRNLKTRRVVLVTPTAQIQVGGTVYAVAITSEIESVPLRWHPKGHVQTSLKVKCVAACHWFVGFPTSSVQNVVGCCSRLELDEILLRVSDATE